MKQQQLINKRTHVLYWNSGETGIILETKKEPVCGLLAKKDPLKDPIINKYRSLFDVNRACDFWTSFETKDVGFGGTIKYYPPRNGYLRLLIPIPEIQQRDSKRCFEETNKIVASVAIIMEWLEDLELNDRSPLPQLFTMKLSCEIDQLAYDARREIIKKWTMVGVCYPEALIQMALIGIDKDNREKKIKMLREAIKSAYRRMYDIPISYDIDFNSGMTFNFFSEECSLGFDKEKRKGEGPCDLWSTKLKNSGQILLTWVALAALSDLVQIEATCRKVKLEKLGK